MALLVNGMVIMGQLAPPEAIAEELDAEWLNTFDLLRRPDDMTDEEWAEMREKVATRIADTVKESREALDQLDEDATQHGGPGIDLATFRAS